MHTRTLFYLYMVFLCLVSSGRLVMQAANTPSSQFSANPQNAPSYRIVETLDLLPFKEVTDIIYDSDRQLWIATRSGLYCYNGAHLRPYRRDVRHPDLISDNEVKRVVEDQQHRIWIASAHGLDRLDKYTGIIEHLTPEGIDVSSITEMIVTRNGHVWLATGPAFVDYDPSTDQFTSIHPITANGSAAYTGGECILEDHRGYLWLGTWKQGLFRYNPKDGEMVAYPQMNSRNSAHVLVEDDQKRIWVAGWSSGIHVLQNAWDPQRVSWQTFMAPDLIGDITYCMTLDADRHQIFIGSSRGLTIADTEHLGRFSKITDPDDGRAMPGGEITGIERSHDGRLWVGMIGDGVAAIEPDQLRFNHATFSGTLPHLKVSSVRSIYADRKERLWLGIGTQGLAVRELSSGLLYNWTEIPALASHESMSTVYAITETFDGHIWAATYGGELIDIVPPPAGEDIRRLKATCYRAGESPLTPSDRIFCLFEDRNDNLWIGGNGGLVQRKPDGSYIRLDSLRVDPYHTMSDLDVRDIDQDADGSFWFSAFHSGVYHLIPQGNSWEVSFFSTSNEGIADNEVQSLCIDHQGTIWVGSHYGELYYYDKQSNIFRSVKEQWNLPGASIAFILNHPEQNDKENEHVLWVGTNVGLLFVESNETLSAARTRLYTVRDGILDNQLIRNAATVAPSGRVYFGTYKGYNDFNPSVLKDEKDLAARPALSMLQIGDIPWNELPEKERRSISKLDPRYSNDLTFTYEQNDFTLEFIHNGSLQQGDNIFAYKLEGYDGMWRYAMGSYPRAYYSNLPAGNYTFKIFATHSNSQPTSAQEADESEILRISIHILPPWYATLGAKCLYWLLGILAFFLIYRGVRSLKSYWMRLLLKARDRAALRKNDIIIKPSKLEVTDQDKDFIARAIACVESNLSDPEYDQQRFLDDMGVSKATCFRKLKALSGKSYTQFVRDIKMKAALRLQKENPHIRISDLAYAVGFSDPKYFSACFKKYFGKLPSEVEE